MSFILRITKIVQNRADEAVADVLLSVLEKNNSEDVPCSLHGEDKKSYVNELISYKRGASNFFELHLARLRYRKNVYECGCSTRYTSDGRKLHGKRKPKHQ